MPGFQPLNSLTQAQILSLIPDEDFSFSMRGWKGDVDDFFAPTDENRVILEERRQYLGETADLYCDAEEAARECLEEMAERAHTWSDGASFETPPEPLALCRELGALLEPDFILLTASDDASFRAVAGAVCFPSSWDFRHTLGKRLHQIHSAVPGLNETIGNRIESLLQKLRPAESWSRLNWGISLSPDRNQHPSRHLPRLHQAETISAAWLRVELQVLHKLPTSGAILFGIRPVSVPLQDFAHTPAAAALKRQLDTMPPALLDYKGIGENARLLDLWL